MNYYGRGIDSQGRICEIFESNGKFFRENPSESAEFVMRKGKAYITKPRHLTVLSYGGGQDSTAILLKILHDPKFRKKYVKGDLLIVMADTGAEHPETYSYIKKYITPLCEEKGLDWVFLTNDKGYHSTPWKDLYHQLERNNTILMKTGRKGSCTWNLKIVPIYRFLDEWVAKKYLGWKDYSFKTGRKKALKTYAEEHGKIRVIIGFSRGEERRVGHAKNEPVWMRKSIEKIYPLITEKMDRKDCQDYIKSVRYVVPIPSNCMTCHFMSEQELLWLYRKHPEKYHWWVKQEKKKLERVRKEGKIPESKNFGVFGKRTLEQVLEDALVKYGKWSDKELSDYKMSHGANITVAY